MGQERANLAQAEKQRPNLNFNALSEREKSDLKNTISEMVLTEYQFSKDIHFFVTTMEQWQKENPTMDEEDAIFLEDTLNSMKELYRLDKETNEPRSLLLENDDAFKLAYELEIVRTKSNEKLSEKELTNDELQKETIGRTEIARIVNKAEASQVVVDEKRILDVLNYLVNPQHVVNSIKKQGNYVSVYPAFGKFLDRIVNKYSDTLHIDNKDSNTVIDNLLAVPIVGQGIMNLLKDYPIKIPQRLAKYNLLYRELGKNVDSQPGTKQHHEIITAYAAAEEATKKVNSMKQYESLIEGQMRAFSNVVISKLEEKKHSSFSEAPFALAAISKLKNAFDQLTIEKNTEINKRINAMTIENITSLTNNEQMYYHVIKNPALVTLKSSYESLIAAEQKHNNFLISRSIFERILDVSSPLLTENEYASKKTIKSVLDGLSQQIKESEQEIQIINKTIKNKKKSLSKKDLNEFAKVKKSAKEKSINTAINTINEMVMNERKIFEKSIINKIDADIKDFKKSTNEIQQRMNMTKNIKSNFDLNILNEVSTAQFKLLTGKWIPFEKKQEGYSNRYHEFLNEQPVIKQNIEQINISLNNIYTLQSKLTNLITIENDLADLKTNVSQYSNKKLIDIFTGDRKNDVKKNLSYFNKDSTRFIENLQSEIEDEKKQLRKELEQENKHLINLDQIMVEQRRKILSDMPIDYHENTANKGLFSANDKVNFFIENVKTELNDLVLKYESNHSFGDKKENESLEEFNSASKAKSMLVLINDLEKNKDIGARERMDKLKNIFSDFKLTNSRHMTDIGDGFTTCYEAIKQDLKFTHKQIKAERMELKQKKISANDLGSVLQYYQNILENLKINTDFVSEDKKSKNEARIVKYKNACKLIEKLHLHEKNKDRHQMMQILSKDQSLVLPDTMADFLKDLKGVIKKQVELEHNDHKKIDHQYHIGLFDHQEDKAKQKAKKDDEDQTILHK